MSFMKEYKRLDNLCKDLLSADRGITEYINAMDGCTNRAFHSTTWSRDYATLKKYRHIRNQIVHETYATEEKLCKPEDTLWLCDFYDRVLNQKDPLSLYLQSERKYRKNANHTAGNAPHSTSHADRPESNDSSGSMYLFLMLIVIGILCVFFALHGM